MNRYILTLVACCGLATAPATQTIDMKSIGYTVAGLAAASEAWHQGMRGVNLIRRIPGLLGEDTLDFIQKSLCLAELRSSLFARLTTTAVCGYITYVCFNKAFGANKEKNDETVQNVEAEQIDQNDDQQLDVQQLNNNETNRLQYTGS